MKKITFLHLFRVTYLLCLIFASLTQVEAQGLARFTENKGQWHANIQYRLQLFGGEMFLEKNRFVYRFMEEAFYNHDHKHGVIPHEEDEKSTFEGHAYYVSFVNANAQSSLRASNSFEDLSHYYIGDNPQNWAENVHAFQDVHYSQVWDGIDTHVYSDNGNVKYDFIVHANTGNPAMIQLKYEGLAPKDISINTAGEVLIDAKVRQIREGKPYAYQLVNGRKVEVPCKYQLNNNQTLSFELGSYNPSLDLIIDPTLIFSTYTGSTQDNWGYTATYDLIGNAFAGGIIWNSTTGFIGYPTTPGALQTTYNGGERDAVITKFNPIGTAIIFSTYLGGSLEEQPQSMICNSLGELIVLGRTNSPNFPTAGQAIDSTANGGYDLFLTKFSPTGQLQIATLLGGSADDGVNGNILYLPITFLEDYLNYNYMDDSRCEVVLDAQDNIYIAACSNSMDFPVTSSAFQPSLHGGRDAVLLKLSANMMNLEWATYYGGNNLDAAYSLKVDNNGHIIFTGGTKSTDLPISTNAYQTSYQGGVTDGFIASLDANGNYVAGTYMGTASYDQSYFVSLDANQNVYVSGQSLGAFPVINAAYSNLYSPQFIAKLNNDLSQIIYSTTIGVPGSTSKINFTPSAFQVDYNENVYIAGWGGGTLASSPGGTTATGAGGGTMIGLPLTSNALQSTTDGSDFYIAAIEANATGLMYGTYMGGSSSQEHLDGGMSRFTQDGVLYEAVCASCGGWDPINGGFPVTAGVWSSTNNSNNCNMGLIKLEVVQNFLKAQANFNPIMGNPLGIQFYSTGSSNGGFEWDFGDNSGKSTLANPAHTYSTSGTYSVSLIVNNDMGADTATIQVTVATTGIPALHSSFFRCYPNPTEKEFTVELKEVGTNDYQLQMYNSLGQIVMNQPIQMLTGKNSEKISVATLPAGLYSVLIRAKNKEYAQTILVK